MRKLRRYFAGLSCGLLIVVITCISFAGSGQPVQTSMVGARMVVSSEVEAVNVPYRLTEGSINGINQFVNAERAEIPESELLEVMNEASIIKETPKPVFPFETTELGEKTIVANTDRDNKSGSKNFDGMTVSVNPNIVPYGGIIYIEKLGFRYNQPSDYNPSNDEIYLYFNSEEEVDAWDGEMLNVYLVHNNKNIDIHSKHDIKTKDRGVFRLTAYCPCPICCEEYAASPEGKTGSKETNVYQGTTIAADPSVLPYGTVVYIENVGIRFVADCGGAINKKEIDVYFTDHDTAWDFGVKHYNVWILQ